MGWLYVIIAGIFEIGFTTAMKLSEGFTKVYPLLFFVAFAIASFYLLTKSLSTLPLGTAYAVWTGIGAFGTAVIGIFYFGEPATVGRIVFLFMLIGSIVGLKLVSPH